MIINNSIAKQLKEDYKRTLISVFGVKESEANTEQIKLSLLTVMNNVRPILGRDNPQEFKNEFRQLFKKQYAKLGIKI